MRFKHYGALLLAVLICGPSLAAGDDVPPEVAAKIRATLHERIPELRVVSIHKSPLPGLYEVNTGSELVYTNDGVLLIANGRIIDSKTRQDLTQARWDELNAIDFDPLPLDLAIKTVRGDGSRK